MNKEYSQAGGLVAVSGFLGFTTLLVSFVAAAILETPAGTSNGELIAPCVAAALYLAFCQFWVAPRGRGRFWAKLLTVVASVAPLLLYVNEHRRAWGIPWVMVSGCLGSAIGSMIAQKVTAAPQGGIPAADSSNRGRRCRNYLLVAFMLLVAIALLIPIVVIPSVLADTASGFNAGPTGKVLGLTVAFDLLAAAILASALWRPRDRDPSSKGTLGTAAFLALFLTLVYCPLGILIAGHGSARRIASVVLVVCAVCGLITSALMIATSVIVDRARLYA
jgi:hypothetical protein